jgi:predicted molibdopterin-dependent oxidoreductase YjgC
VQSMPYLSKVHEEFKKAFVIIHTTYPNSCAEEFADVVLPCCGWSEREGTYTNAESRVRWLNKAIEPLFNTKPNYLIYAELAKKFGFEFPKNVEDIFQEIKLKRPNYDEIDINKVKSEEGQFVTKGAKYEKIVLREPLIEDIQPSKEYPYLITTARLPFQFVTGEYSSRSKTINSLAPEALCLINPEDAKNNSINEGDVFSIKSEVGEIEIKAKLTSKVPKGILVAPFHFEKTLFNKLVPLNFNKEVGEPNLKRIPVAIFPIKNQK